MSEVLGRRHGPLAERTVPNGRIIINLPQLPILNYDITDLVTSASINYTMDLASELSFEIVDPGLNFAKNNYFIIGRDVMYETQTIGRINSQTGDVIRVRQMFEIAKVQVSQGPGGSPTFSIQCYTKAIQQMRRDRKPGSIPGNGTAFVRAAAAKYGLQFYGEQTSKVKQITKTKGSKQAQSLWDVMQTLASDAKFVLFEVDGILVFASEKYLLHKWGTEQVTVPKTITNAKTGKKTIVQKKQNFVDLQFRAFRYKPAKTGSEFISRHKAFELTEVPTITQSFNDPYAGDGSCTVLRTNGTQLRPGMTAFVGDVPNMSGYYLITDVSFNELTGDPVSVGFRTPQRDETKEAVKDLPIGSVFQQTYISNLDVVNPRSPITSKNIATVSFDKSTGLDKRILPLPTQDSPYSYPKMKVANLTQSYPLLRASIYGTLKPHKDSTLEFETLTVTGNIDLYNRPVLAKRQGKSKIIDFQTLSSITHTFESGSEWLSVLLPTVFTEGGEAVVKPSSQVIADYEANGGWEGSAKHLGVIRGSTRMNSIANARDYAFLLSWQQNHTLFKRLSKSQLQNPNLNIPGGEDSEWTAGG